MAVRYEINTAPATEPVTTAEAKTFMRVDTSDDDTLIAELITAARLKAEKLTNIRFVTQTWDFYLDHFTYEIVLPLVPVASITHVQYIDTGGTLTTLVSGTDFTSDLNGLRCRIMPYYGTTWPNERTQEYGTVTIQAILGVADSAVDEDLKLLIKLITSMFYENRCGGTDKMILANPAIKCIIDANKVYNI